MGEGVKRAFSTGRSDMTHTEFERKSSGLTECISLLGQKAPMKKRSTRGGAKQVVTEIVVLVQPGNAQRLMFLWVRAIALSRAR